MYRDELKKIEYYKQYLIDQYLKQGKLISKNELEKKINDLNLKIAVFSQAYIDNGENLDLEKFQAQKEDIYRDLAILYEIVFDLAKERLSKVQARIEYAVNYLNEIAKKYQYRNALESVGIFGDTVYYATNGFDQSYDNGTVKINLGSLTIKSGTYLTCTLGCQEFEEERAVFYLDNYSVSDYFYNKNMLTILGNYEIKTYDYSLEENTSTSFKISLEDFTPDENNQYNIFGGKNVIRVFNPDDGSVQFVNKIENVPFIADQNCEITFYIYGSKNVIFDFNDKYEEKSFSGYEIKTPKQRQKVYIKAQAGFILDFSTDGTLYANKTQGYIEEGELYSNNGFGTITDFMVEEMAFGEPIQINDAVVEIKNAANTFYDINYILIKETQISELDSDNL